MGARREDRTGESWSYRIEGSAVVFDLRDLPAHAGREELLPAFEAFGEVAFRDDVTASVSIVPEEGGISREAFDLVEENADTIARAGLEKLAYVGPKLKGMALESSIPDADYEVETFEDLETALAWANDAG